MAQPEHLQTPATIELTQYQVSFTSHQFPYEACGGTRTPASVLGLSEHNVVKTLVMEDEASTPLIVLMHGDRKVSTKALAREVGCKRITPCTPATAQKHTGYIVGGTSPFGLRKAIPIYVEKTVLDLSVLYINGGRRGYAVAITPADLIRVLAVTEVNVAQ